ncbi:MAG TPA: HIT family protein [Marinobacter sp.]|uniref:HIT family protein n=2 Tax=root TaxID=1 RepID=A0A831W179_9GAMM|nr:HIT family protein [Marinobacter antarcticus]HDZ38316.1 HIT family protein [Marinobacter sp.]HEA54075.1 HIT family protein [Marinobacter antarcticus]
MEQNCPFCAVNETSEHGPMASNALAHICLDGFPVSKGHLLIIPNRHASDWFDLTSAEQQAIMELVKQGKQWLEERYQPDGYNIGMNCGAAAGQTVLHMHCHLIPRYAGDQHDPRGGVRWVIPEKADYWSGR